MTAAASTIEEHRQQNNRQPYLTPKDEQSEVGVEDRILCEPRSIATSSTRGRIKLFDMIEQRITGRPRVKHGSYTRTVGTIFSTNVRFGTSRMKLGLGVDVEKGLLEGRE